eukprot:9326565-Pyramimonas_sp.AAC.1
MISSDTFYRSGKQLPDELLERRFHCAPRAVGLLGIGRREIRSSEEFGGPRAATWWYEQARERRLRLDIA